MGLTGGRIAVLVVALVGPPLSAAPNYAPKPRDHRVAALAGCVILGGDHNVNECRTYKRYYKSLPREEWGVLRPADDPAHPDCGRKGAYLSIEAGSNVLLASNFPFTFIRVYGRPELEIDRANNSISIKQLHIFDDTGRLIASVHRDKFWVLKDPMISHVDKPDKSTLIVYDYKDYVALKLRYMNDKTLYVEGVFRNESHSVTISDTKITIMDPPNSTGYGFGRDCFIDEAFDLSADGLNVGMPRER